MVDNSLMVNDGDRTVIDPLFSLRFDRTPKEIDLDLDWKIAKGIYTWNGRARKIARGEIGSDRPAAFESKDGSKIAVLQFQRKK